LPPMKENRSQLVDPACSTFRQIRGSNQRQLDAILEVDVNLTALEKSHFVSFLWRATGLSAP